MIAPDCSVLVVEDEPLVALMIEDMLRDMGAATIALAHNQETAQQALEQNEHRLAIMDFNLGAQDCLGLVADCQRRGVAVVLATGYAVQDLPAEIGDLPILNKPFSQDQLIAAVNGALGANLGQV